MNRQMNDQAMILDAISTVRLELSSSCSESEMVEIMTRLSTLYSLLNVDLIRDTLESADARDNYNDRRVA